MPGCYARFPMPRFLRSHREATDPSKVEHCLAPGKDTFERAQPFLFVSWRCYVGVLGIGWVQPDSTIRVFAKAMLVNIYIYYNYIYISVSISLYIYIYIYRVCVVVSRAIWKGHLRSVWVAASVVTGARGAQEFIPQWALICAVHKLFLSSIKASKVNIAMAHPLSHQQTFPHFFLLWTRQFNGSNAASNEIHTHDYSYMFT